MSILALSMFSSSVFFTLPEIVPAQSVSEQSIFPLQLLSKLSVHASSLVVFSMHFPETKVSQTAGALSHVVSWHCLSTPSPSESVPEFDHEQLLVHV